MDSSNRGNQGGRGGRGRGGYPQQNSGAEAGRGRGRGRGARPQDQSSGGYSGGQSPAQSTFFSHSQTRRTDEGPRAQGAGSSPWGQGRGGQPLGRGRATSIRGFAPPPEPVAQSSAGASSTPAVQPTSVVKVVEEMESLKIKPEEEVAAAESSSKKKKKRKQKGAVEPQPSSSDAAEPSATGSQPSTSTDKTAAPPPPSSEYANIPKRKKNVPISSDTNYFDPTYAEKIEVNYLPITFTNPNMKVYHYDIEYPKNANKEAVRRLVAEMKRIHYPNRYPSFDGTKNLYAAGNPLFSGNALTSTITLNTGGKDAEYTITLKRAAENVELTVSSLTRYMKQNGCSTNRPQSMIQALEVALRSGLPDRFTSCGRGLYEPPAARPVKLSDGLQLYSGFVQSSVLGFEPFVNIDVSHRGFYTPQTLLDYLREVTGRPNIPVNERLPDAIFRTMDEYLKQNNGLKIRYIDPRSNTPRTYRCAGLCHKNAMEAFFELNTDGATAPRRISVYDYFQTMKGYKIQYPQLPVIQVGNKKELFPLECCRIDEKQPVQNSYRYSPQETQAMIANCKDLPHQRKQKILSSIRNASFGQNPVLREFGINVNDRKFLEVEAAYLHPPIVTYKNGPAEIDNGVWKAQKFVDGRRITTWICVNMNRSTQAHDIKKLEDLLMGNANAVGMEMARPQQFRCLTRSDESSIEHFFNELKSQYPNLQLVMLILPGGYETDLVYRRVKYVSEIKVGLLTQCAKPVTVGKVSWMTARNFLMKINSKLSGLNHIMNHPKTNKAIFDGSTMFVGADVTHPRPGSNPESERSISAVAGSYDKDGSKYKMLYHIQKSREEMIQGMERMIRVLLMFFKQNTGKFPAKLFYYRDGVSDGQFLQVLNTELWAIKQACLKLAVNVQVTFLVVQKRHHTRFFPKGQLADKKGNVYAGTVVNSVITHPFEHDFYMVSHQSIQGTARPTKYHVLYDEIGESDAYIEALTYYLCYMFVRCTRAVSYPAPTYYAHLAAARAEKYVKCVKENTTNLDRDLSAGCLGEGTIHSALAGNSMYFV